MTPANEGSRLNAVGKLLFFFFLLYVFFLTIGMMGSAFKLFGKSFAESLFETTRNPLVGLCIGILATSVVQSSSFTTSMIVALAAAGTLPLTAAIPMVMGANIGTSVTNTAICFAYVRRRREFALAFGGGTCHDMFNFFAVLLLFPIEIIFHPLEKLSTGLTSGFKGLGGVTFVSPLKVITKPPIDFLKDLLTVQFGFSEVLAGIILAALAFVLLYVALYFITNTMKSLVLGKFGDLFNRFVARRSVFYRMGFGAMLTAMVQSSSVVTSTMVPMIAARLLTIEQKFPITLGANIGTTITALLAAVSAAALSNSEVGISVALAHLFFNILGIALIFPHKRIRQIPIRMARNLGAAAGKRTLYPVLYIVLLFYALPLLVIVIHQLLARFFE